MNQKFLTEKIYTDFGIKVEKLDSDMNFNFDEIVPVGLRMWNKKAPDSVLGLGDLRKLLTGK